MNAAEAWRENKARSHFLQPFSCKSEYESSIIIIARPAETHRPHFQQALRAFFWHLRRCDQGSFHRATTRTSQLLNGPRGETTLRSAAVKQVPEVDTSICRATESVSGCARVARWGLPKPFSTSSSSTVKVERWAWLYCIAERKRDGEREREKHTCSRAVLRAERLGGDRCEMRVDKQKKRERGVTSARPLITGMRRERQRDLHVITVGESSRQTGLNHLDECVKSSYGWRETWWCATTQVDGKVKRLEKWNTQP